MVVWECRVRVLHGPPAKAMGNDKFRGLPALGSIFKKIWTVDYAVDPIPHANIVVNRFKGGVSAHAWNCHPQASIFSFFDLMRFAIGQPVGTIVAVNGSNDASWWPSRPFYGFVNKKILFSIFYSKMWKIALHSMWTLNSYNFGIVEDTYKLFAPNRGFQGWPI